MKPTTTTEVVKEKKRSFSHGSSEGESPLKRSTNEKIKKPKMDFVEERRSLAGFRIGKKESLYWKTHQRMAKMSKASIGGRSKKAPKITGDKDVFCWTCHRSGILTVCSKCPRAYHLKCGHLDKNPTAGDKWACLECDNVARAVRISNASPPVKPEMFAKMLGFVVDRVKLIEGSEHFCVPVDTNKWHDYRDYVIKPMDLPQLERNIEQHKYTCVEEFLADFRWMVHDSYVYNSVHSAFTKIAKSMFAIAKQECEEMRNCADCYLHAYTLDEETWFVEPCTVPHILVWAQLSGFPYWPGKVMKSIGSDLLDVRFFGDHSRANVPLSSCFLYSRVMPCIFKKNSKHAKIEKGIEEAEDHVRKLKEAFGTFYYALYRVPYVHKDEELIRKLQLPEFHGSNETQEFLAEVELMRNDKMIVDKEFQTEMKQMLAQKKVQLPAKRKSSSDAHSKDNPKRMLVQVNTPMGPKVAVMNLSGSDSDSSPKGAFNKKAVTFPKKQTSPFCAAKQNVIIAEVARNNSFTSPKSKTEVALKSKTRVDNNKKLSPKKLPSPKIITLVAPYKKEFNNSGVNVENCKELNDQSTPLINSTSELALSSSKFIHGLPDAECDSTLPHMSDEFLVTNAKHSSEGGNSSKATIQEAESTLPDYQNQTVDSLASSFFNELPHLESLRLSTKFSLRPTSHLLDLLNGDISKIYDTFDQESNDLVERDSIIDDEESLLMVKALTDSNSQLCEEKDSKRKADSLILCDSITSDTMEEITSSSPLIVNSDCSSGAQMSKVCSTIDSRDIGELATSSCSSLRTTSATKPDLAKSPLEPLVNLGTASNNEAQHHVQKVKSCSELSLTARTTQLSVNNESNSEKTDCGTPSVTDSDGFIQISSAISLSEGSKTSSITAQQSPRKDNILKTTVRTSKDNSCSSENNQKNSTKPDEVIGENSKSKNINSTAKLDVINGMPIPLILPKIEPIDEIVAGEKPVESLLIEVPKLPTIKVVQTSSLLERPPLKEEKRDCQSPKNNLIPPFDSKRNINDIRKLIDTKSQFISPKLKQAVFTMLEEVEVEYETYIDQITNVAERRLEHVEAAFETDKKKLFEDFKSKLRDEMDRQITAIKRKQWCAHCGVEASFHCCWNYAYCGERCQKEDWATHNKICTQYNMSATDPFIKVSPRFQALLDKQNTSPNPRKILIQDLIDYPVAVTVSSPNKQIYIKDKNKAKVSPRSSIKGEFAPTISIPEQELPDLPKPPPAIKSLLVAPVQRLNNGEQFKFPNGKSYPVKIMPTQQQSRGPRINVLPNSTIRFDPNTNKSYYIVNNDKKSFQPINSPSMPSSSSSTNLAKNPKAHTSPSIPSSSKAAVHLQRSSPIGSYSLQNVNKTTSPMANKFRGEPPIRILPKVKVPSSILPTKPSIRVIDETEIASILSGRNRV